MSSGEIAMFFAAIAASAISIYQTMLTRDALNVSLKTNLQSHIINACEASLASLSSLSVAYSYDDHDKFAQFLPVMKSQNSSDPNAQTGDEKYVSEIRDGFVREFASENMQIARKAGSDLDLLKIYSTDQGSLALSSLSDDIFELSLAVATTHVFEKAGAGKITYTHGAPKDILNRVKSGVELVKSKCREIMLGNNTGLL